MKVFVIALLKPSQIQHKIVPLSKSKWVGEVLIVRKYPGPEIEKVRYLLLPRICRFKLFNLLLTPFVLLYHASRQKADILLGYHFVPHGFFAWFVSVFTRTPFIYSQIDMGVQHLVEIPIVGRIVRSIIQKAVFINVPGSQSRNFWIRQNFEASRINVLHSTVDPIHGFFPGNIPKEYDLIYVGVLEKRKRIDRMIKALAELRSIGHHPSLLIVGGGKRKRHLEKLCLELDLTDRIRLIGHKEDVFTLMNQATFFLLTSDNEGIPCAMLEAMACGLIPISTDVADVSDVVIDGVTGALIKDARVESIRDVIISMLHDTEKRSFYSANARKIIVEEHSHDSAVRKWNELLIKFRK